jgi:hypothetical protein
MILKRGPLQRAGYDKEATTPFKLEETEGTEPKKEKKKPQTIGSSEFSRLEQMGARGEAGGLLPASYLTKAGVPGYEGKKGKFTISEKEAEQVRAYKASKKV